MGVFEKQAIMFFVFIQRYRFLYIYILFIENLSCSCIRFNKKIDKKTCKIGDPIL